MRWTLLILAMPIVLMGGCYELGASSGGGQVKSLKTRTINPNDIELPRGYRIEVVAQGLNFPTGVAFDEQGRPCVVESGYSYGEVWTTPRLVRIEGNGSTTEIAHGDGAPWTGVAFHGGAFYVAQGGEKDGGRIVRISSDGTITPLVEHLPSIGDHHTNGPAIGPDGAIYFAIGTATNSGVVGEDNFNFGWAKRHPEFHDIPARDITLSGENFTTNDPIHGGKATTGAYLPFGTPSQKGQIIRGQIPCTGGVFRIAGTSASTNATVQPATSTARVELVAWGLRNPFGLGFGPDGKLYATENSYDSRGSRPIWGTGDCFYRIEEGTWYAWPDFHAGEPLTWSDHYQAPYRPKPKFLLAEHPYKPPEPIAILGVHSSANGFDFSRSERFGYPGEAFITEFGDMAPGVGKVLEPVGFKVVRVNVDSGIVHDFAINKGKTYGPASYLKSGGLERPTAARFDPSGNALYVVDFGILRMQGDHAMPVQNTGVLWRITREVTP
jgi:glucose/arabinose dehydrogenase